MHDAQTVHPLYILSHPASPLVNLYIAELYVLFVKHITIEAYFLTPPVRESASMECDIGTRSIKSHVHTL